MPEQDESILPQMGSGPTMHSIEEGVGAVQAEATETNQFGDSWSKWQVEDGDEEDVEGSSESDDSDDEFVADSLKLVPSTKSTKKGSRGARRSNIAVFRQLNRSEERMRKKRGSRRVGGHGNEVSESGVYDTGDGYGESENGNNSNKLNRKGGNRAHNTNPPVEVSPMAKYLKWHSRDKRTLYNLKRTLQLAHDIIQKKCIQEVIDERVGKIKSSIAFFFEDYFFRNFGHLAKYSLRCFVHSLVHHKDQGDRRAEIFALITGLHHPELYSNALSVMFTRLIRGLFPDHKYIRASLDKYDGKTHSSNCVVSRKIMWRALIGENGVLQKPDTWYFPEIQFIAKEIDFSREIVRKASTIPTTGNDQRKLTDIDPIILLVIDFFVISGIQMQIRMRHFFTNLMESSATTAAIAQASARKEGSGLSSAHMHVTWDDFQAYGKLCKMPVREERLMEVFTEFHEKLDAEEVEEEEEEAEEDAEEAEELARRLALDDDKSPAAHWAALRSGGLAKSVAIETKEMTRNRKRIECEARILAALCYQAGLYIPFTVEHADKASVMRLLMHHKKPPGS
jgi:hypothetical protein